MKLRRQQITRVLAGLVLLVVAAFLAAVIRNGLAQRDPENALPTMQLSFITEQGPTALPVSIVRTDTYDWNFMFWRRTGGGKDLEPWREIESSWAAPNSALELWFTFEPKSYQVYIKAGESEFVEYNDFVIPGPSEPTEYTLKVEANWGNGKDVTYYAKIKVDTW